MPEIDFSKDDIGFSSAPPPKPIDYNARLKAIEDAKTPDDDALANPVTTLMNAAMLLKLETSFEWFDGDGRKHGKGGEPPRVGLKCCKAICGDCEVMGDPYMMKKDAKADACEKLLPDVKAWGWFLFPKNFEKIMDTLFMKISSSSCNFCTMKLFQPPSHGCIRRLEQSPY